MGTVEIMILYKQVETFQWNLIRIFDSRLQNKTKKEEFYTGKRDKKNQFTLDIEIAGILDIKIMFKHTNYW